MPQYIAFLRAINVGGGRTLKMDVLRQLFGSLGLAKVETFIASGNIVFETNSKSSRALEKKIESTLAQALGYEVPTFIRTDAEVAKIARYEPFQHYKSDGLSELYIIFLSSSLDAACRKKVIALCTDHDEFRVLGREIYWLRHRKPDGYSFSAVPLEKALGRTFTIRSARTVKKLAAKYCK